jgi:serine protease Do
MDGKRLEPPADKKRYIVMKRTSKLHIALIIVLLIAIAVMACGCNQSGTASGTNATSQTTQDAESTQTPAKQNGMTKGSPVVSYISTDSKVYSSTAEIVNDVADTVVEISTETVTTQWGRQYILSGAGSGVIVGIADNTYYVITNNHVISGASEITVRTRAGVSYTGTLVATDDSTDIAVVTIQSDTALSIARLGNSDSLQIGEDLIAIGNPLGNLGGTVTKGILSATGRSIQINNYAMTLLQTDTAINPGNSGGGLFNMRGDLIGIVNAKSSDEEIEGICFAIPINIAKKVYDDLVEYGYIRGRSTFNIEVAEGTISYGMMGMQAKSIVYIASLGDNASNGFKQYDMIYKVNGVEISSILDYNIAMSQIAVGAEVEVEVYRGSISSSYWSSGINFDNEPTTFTTTAKQYGA